MAKTRKIFMGTKDFQGTVDITDPCYNRDVWCRRNNVRIAEGSYRCFAWEEDCGVWGKRISRIGIFSEEKLGKDEVAQKTLPEEFDVIGVDSGTAGFFHDKKDFSDGEWLEFCKRISWKAPLHAWLLDEGFCSSSGYGDGEYPVYARRDEHGLIVALDIRFF